MARASASGFALYKEREDWYEAQISTMKDEDEWSDEESGDENESLDM